MSGGSPSSLKKSPGLQSGSIVCSPLANQPCMLPLTYVEHKLRAPHAFPLTLHFT